MQTRTMVNSAATGVPNSQALTLCTCTAHWPFMVGLLCNALPPKEGWRVRAGIPTKMADTADDLAVLRDYLQRSASDVAVGKLDAQQTSYLHQVWGLAESSSHHTLCGDTPLSRAEVRQWVEYRTSHLGADMGRKNLRNVLKELDAFLLTRSFLVGRELSLADLVLYTALHRHLDALDVQERSALCSVARWFCLIQDSPRLRPKGWRRVVFLSNPNLLS